MKLQDLLPQLKNNDAEVRGISSDSRLIKPGYIFVALKGNKEDGARYIKDAIEKGAIAVVAAAETPLPSNAVALIQSSEPRKTLSDLAARFYAAQPAHVVAVTGTNGKTSTVFFVEQIWTMLGHKAASLGTIGLSTPKGLREGSLTTPDPILLHQDLAALHHEGIDHLAMEASSHGLDQYRLHGIKIEAAAFTNLTRDHIDYHGDMETYYEAKAKLFTEILTPGGTAVINADSPYGEDLARRARARNARVLTYGLAGRDIQVHQADPLPQGSRLSFSCLGKKYDMHFPLTGRFQIWNAMAALGLTIGSGDDPQKAATSIEKLSGVKGRLQLVGTKGKAAIYVDYAHTPDALEHVLQGLRPHTHKKLHVVFGCGGGRDRGKRAMMGEIAARLADHVIVTDDNPRNEVPEAIRKDVMAACPTATEIGNRRDAIAAGIRALNDGDVLVVAGKGHERGQKIGDTVFPFDDAEVIEEILRAQSA